MDKMRTTILQNFFLVTLLLLAWQLNAVAAESFVVNETAQLVGENRPYRLNKGETLIELARRSGTGYTALSHANPGLDPWLPPTDREILLPLAGIVPERAQPGITVNLAELRLYLLWQKQGETLVRIYPVGIGREGKTTPLGRYTVINLVTNPSWTQPPDSRAERPGLPAVVPPGPDNPLGNHWIGLSGHRLGLHGTNRPYGIGREVSRGCIRLYPEHIAELFDRTNRGMPVNIIYQPVKLGQRDGVLYLEAHPDPRELVLMPLTEIMRQRDRIAPGAELDWQAVRLVLQQQTGVPQPVSLQKKLPHQ